MMDGRCIICRDQVIQHLQPQPIVFRVYIMWFWCRDMFVMLALFVLCVHFAINSYKP